MASETRLPDKPVYGFELTSALRGDSPRLVPLLERIRWPLGDVCGDKAYASRANAQYVEDRGGRPYLMPKGNATAKARGCPAWRRMVLSRRRHPRAFERRYRTFASVPKARLELLAPELARAIPTKSVLWEDWSVWNFKRHRLNRFKALPAEAVQRVRRSLRDFERLEVWQAVGMADPWLVGVMATPTGSERFYLLYDWGLETTLDRDLWR